MYFSNILSFKLKKPLIQFELSHLIVYNNKKIKKKIIYTNNEIYGVNFQGKLIHI